MNKKKNEEEIERLKHSILDKDKFELRAQKLNFLADGLSEEALYSEAKIFKALSDVNRLKIVQLLKEGELCACELTFALSNSQSTVSHYLSVLKNAGLIKERKEGKWSYFRLSDGAIIELLKPEFILSYIKPHQKTLFPYGLIKKLKVLVRMPTFLIYNSNIQS